MPTHAELHKETEALSKASGLPAGDGDLEEIEAETEEAPDKEAIMKRLKAQGAVRVFPGSDPESSSAAPAPIQAEEEESSEGEEEEAPKVEAPTTPAAEAGASAPEASGAGTTDPAFHERVKKMTDAANNPKWYDLPQHIENARHGEWDLSQSRERSGARERDVNMEEDVRTNKIGHERAPGMFDVKQKAKNAIDGAVSNPGQTAAGMIPLLGKGIKQKMAEKYDVKERDLLKGISATTTSDSIRESTASQSSAVAAKISNDRFKAGVGTVTGIVGDVVPLSGAGKAASAVGAVAGMIGDRVNKKEIDQVNSSRDRSRARREMGGAEFGAYENIDEFMGMEKQRHALVAAGKGDKAAGAGAPAIESAEQVKRLTAHARGETLHHEHYKRRAKEVEKERAAAAKPKEEGAGMLSRMKNFFKRG
ncbi:hypothetical protein [Cohnella lupini]|uniref:Uncharacterized protein n=1 Tax=Cohnella lupini TaxID=1294267 RepID=A0A3D9I709_9BACL|nr:hypothetical protein [Cohnella lupini]RED57532.1 hypothetical protein DFP95_1104 [Cohnella lupini]